LTAHGGRPTFGAVPKGKPAKAAGERTIHFVSLGCPKNRVDTEVMLGVSGQAGYRVVDDAAAAEIIVVNTCGFIESAKQESIDTIIELSQLKKDGACKRLVVAGCLTQRYPEELSKGMPEIDHLLGSSDMLALGRILGDGERAPRMLVGNPADYIWKLGDPRQLSLAPHSAYVKIAEGCSRKCAFCAIPSFRGTQRSRPIADVVAEVERLCNAGTVEINLISQDTVSYGRDLRDGSNLEQLVKALLQVESLGWLRLFYLYPDALGDGIVELLAADNKLVPYVDMPMQHATDRMLKRMRRGYNQRRQRELCAHLRQAVPALSFRTAFIVGHPGETEQDFAALCEFVEESAFDHVGVFRYSHEEGTHSGTLEDLVDEDTVSARIEQLMGIQRAISRKKLKARIGQTLDVLVEGLSDESELLLQGRHPGQAPDVDGVVLLTNGTAQPGELRRAKVKQAADYDLVAELLPDRTPKTRSTGTVAKNKQRARLPLAP
jgi:ribosomal protein S12 methylthiotransferase